MIFKRDNFWMGIIMGFIAPILGIVLFKLTKLSGSSLGASLHFMLFEEYGYRTLTAALSLSLLMNAVLFTIYINNHKDKTAKGIFTTTLVYGLLVLIIKTFL